MIIYKLRCVEENYYNVYKKLCKGEKQRTTLKMN